MWCVFRESESASRWDLGAAVVVGRTGCCWRARAPGGAAAVRGGLGDGRGTKGKLRRQGVCLGASVARPPQKGVAVRMRGGRGSRSEGSSSRDPDQGRPCCSISHGEKKVHVASLVARSQVAERATRGRGNRRGRTSGPRKTNAQHPHPHIENAIQAPRLCHRRSRRARACNQQISVADLCTTTAN